jgi:hypothetical protein
MFFFFCFYDKIIHFPVDSVEPPAGSRIINLKSSCLQLSGPFCGTFRGTRHITSDYFQQSENSGRVGVSNTQSRTYRPTRPAGLGPRKFPRHAVGRASKLATLPAPRHGSSALIGRISTNIPQPGKCVAMMLAADCQGQRLCK